MVRVRVDDAGSDRRSGRVDIRRIRIDLEVEAHVDDAIPSHPDVGALVDRARRRHDARVAQHERGGRGDCGRSVLRGRGGRKPRREHEADRCREAPAPDRAGAATARGVPNGHDAELQPASVCGGGTPRVQERSVMQSRKAR